MALTSALWQLPERLGGLAVFLAGKAQVMCNSRATFGISVDKKVSPVDREENPPDARILYDLSQVTVPTGIHLH
jgi:hypothetical protein